MRIKKISLCVASFVMFGLATVLYAAEGGFYFGAEGGKTFYHNQKQSLHTTPCVIDPVTGITTCSANTVTLNPSNSGVGGRMFAGYNINNYFGLEGGFTHYAPSTYKVSATMTPALAAGNPTGNPAITANGVDFVAKGMIPIGTLGLTPFVKGGVAIIRASKAGTFTSQLNTTGSSAGSPPTATSNYFRPTATIGVGYHLSQSWETLFEASQVFGGGGFQTANLVSLGISYHFVDTYCGQFLC